MKTLLAVSVLAMSACGEGEYASRHDPKCPRSTRTVLRYDGNDCEGFANAAARMEVVFSREMPSTRDLLRGWQVQLVDTKDGYWVDGYGRKVAGLTHCYSKVIEIGSENWATGALANESMHASFCPNEPEGHDHWQAWQWAVIREAKEGL